MKFLPMLAVAGILTAGLPMLTGCDETIEKRETVDVKKDGTVIHKKEEVKKEPDGTIVKEEKKTVDKP